MGILRYLSHEMSDSRHQMKKNRNTYLKV